MSLICRFCIEEGWLSDVPLTKRSLIVHSTIEKRAVIPEQSAPEADWSILVCSHCTTTRGTNKLNEAFLRRSNVASPDRSQA